MNAKDRDRFDAQVELVLAGLPRQVLDLLDDVPLVVEDYPSEAVQREHNLEFRDELCGLYDGVPLTEPEHRASRPLPDCIQIFREGIVAEATDERGRVSRKELRRQIRITILHEMGHHFGLDEDDLRALGYE